jgi:MYXO-CTERM domain-containing protein
LPAKELLTKVEQAPSASRITLVVEGLSLEGDTVRKTVSVPLGDPKEPRLRLRAVGLGVVPTGDKVTISNVAFGSYAKRLGLEAGYEVVSVLEPAPRPSQLWPIGGGFMLAGLVALLQWRRRDAASPKPAPAS